MLEVVISLLFLCLSFPIISLSLISLWLVKEKIAYQNAGKTLNRTSKEMPDSVEDVSEEDFIDEEETFNGVSASAINPSVIEREKAYDAKIEAMKLELELERNKRKAGVIFDEDHDVIGKYIPKPEHEVAE